MPLLAGLFGEAAIGGIKALGGKKKKKKGATGKGGIDPDAWRTSMNGSADDDNDDDAVVRRRRRRRRLLTTQDKSDIAFLIGLLGKGQAGQAAISTLLARRC